MHHQPKRYARTSLNTQLSFLAHARLTVQA